MASTSSVTTSCYSTPGQLSQQVGASAMHVPVSAISNPDLVPLYNMLATLTQEVRAGNATTEMLRKDIRAQNDKYDSLAMDLEYQEEVLNSTLEQHNKCANKVDMLANIACKHGDELIEIRNELLELKKSKTKNNLLIFGIAKKDEEDCLEVVKNFIKLKLELNEELKIHKAYRKSESPNSPICVEFKYHSEKGKVYKYAKNLKGKVNELGKSFQISDDLPPRAQEQNRKRRQMIAKAKSNTAANIKTSVKKNQLMFNNTAYKQKVPLPSEADMLKMDNDELKLVQEKSLIALPQFTERGNSYFAYAAETADIQEIRSLYKHLRIKHLDSTHIMMAHNLAGELPDNQDYEDNGEHGGGSRLLNYLVKGKHVNTVVFIVRYHSGHNLGSRRFEILNELLERLIPLLREEGPSKSKLESSNYRVKTPKGRSIRGKAPGARGAAHNALPRGAARGGSGRGKSPLKSSYADIVRPLTTSNPLNFQPTHSIPMGNRYSALCQETDSDAEVIFNMNMNQQVTGEARKTPLATD